MAECKETLPQTPERVLQGLEDVELRQSLHYSENPIIAYICQPTTHKSPPTITSEMFSFLHHHILSPAPPAKRTVYLFWTGDARLPLPDAEPLLELHKTMWLSLQDRAHITSDTFKQPTKTHLPSGGVPDVSRTESLKRVLFHLTQLPWVLMVQIWNRIRLSFASSGTYTLSDYLERIHQFTVIRCDQGLTDALMDQITSQTPESGQQRGLIIFDGPALDDSYLNRYENLRELILNNGQHNHDIIMCNTTYMAPAVFSPNIRAHFDVKAVLPPPIEIGWTPALDSFSPLFPTWNSLFLYLFRTFKTRKSFSQLVLGTWFTRESIVEERISPKHFRLSLKDTAENSQQLAMHLGLCA